MAQILFCYGYLRGSSIAQGNGQKATKVAVRLKIRSQKSYGRTVPDGEPGTQYGLDTGLHSRLIEPDASVEAVVREGHSFLAQGNDFLDQFLRGECSPKEGISALNLKMYKIIHFNIS
jgi:hypothetical protein